MFFSATYIIFIISKDLQMEYTHTQKNQSLKNFREWYHYTIIERLTGDKLKHTTCSWKDRRQRPNAIILDAWISLPMIKSMLPSCPHKRNNYYTETHLFDGLFWPASGTINDCMNTNQCCRNGLWFAKVGLFHKTSHLLQHLNSTQPN